MNISWQVYVFNGLCTTFFCFPLDSQTLALSFWQLNEFRLGVRIHCIASLEGSGALCPLAKFRDASIYKRSASASILIISQRHKKTQCVGFYVQLFLSPALHIGFICGARRSINSNNAFYALARSNPNQNFKISFFGLPHQSQNLFFALSFI